MPKISEEKDNSSANEYPLRITWTLCMSLSFHDGSPEDSDHDSGSGSDNHCGMQQIVNADALCKFFPHTLGDIGHRTRAIIDEVHHGAERTLTGGQIDDARHFIGDRLWISVCRRQGRQSCADLIH